MVKMRRQVLIPLGEQNVPARFVTFDGFLSGEEHFAVVFGNLDPSASPLTRVHSECLTGDVFGSRRCDCGPQLREAIQRISDSGGILLYLRQEGRGIGFNAKMDAYHLQDEGLDTFQANIRLGHPADARTFSPASSMLLALGFKSIRLMTNNPQKVTEIGAGGVVVAEVVPTGVYMSEHNRRYLESKSLTAGHSILLDRKQGA